jgi:hypothetical protein
MLETRQREQVDAAGYEKYQGDQRLTSGLIVQQNIVAKPSKYPKECSVDHNSYPLSPHTPSQH